MIAVLDQLRDTVTMLDQAYGIARNELNGQIAGGGLRQGFQPEEFRDASGRFILLDALTALATAQAALATLEAAQPRPRPVRV
jgi:hypothetical protein